jgi:hypothetical protein
MASVPALRHACFCRNGAAMMVRNVLLACGTLSSLLYGAMFSGIRFDGYSPVSKAYRKL